MWFSCCSFPLPGPHHQFAFAMVAPEPYALLFSLATAVLFLARVFAAVWFVPRVYSVVTAAIEALSLASSLVVAVVIGEVWWQA